MNRVKYIVLPILVTLIIFPCGIKSLEYNREKPKLSIVIHPNFIGEKSTAKYLEIAASRLNWEAVIIDYFQIEKSSNRTFLNDSEMILNLSVLPFFSSNVNVYQIFSVPTPIKSV